MNTFWLKTLRIQLAVLAVAWVIAFLTGDTHLGTIGFWLAAESIALAVIGGLTGLGGLSANAWDSTNPNRTIVNHQISGGQKFYQDIQRSSMSFQMTLFVNAIIAFVVGLILAMIAG
jgi:hypothetical protein